VKRIQLQVEEVATREIQPKPEGRGFQITIPKKEVAVPLGLKGHEKVRILVDKKAGRIVLELIR
jgi:shikimate 5-dehydrogenase